MTFRLSGTVSLTNKLVTLCCPSIKDIDGCNVEELTRAEVIMAEVHPRLFALGSLVAAVVLWGTPAAAGPAGARGDTELSTRKCTRGDAGGAARRSGTQYLSRPMLCYI